MPRLDWRLAFLYHNLVGGHDVEYILFNFLQRERYRLYVPIRVTIIANIIIKKYSICRNLCAYRCWLSAGSGRSGGLVRRETKVGQNYSRGDTTSRK